MGTRQAVESWKVNPQVAADRKELEGIVIPVPPPVITVVVIAAIRACKRIRYSIYIQSTPGIYSHCLWSAHPTWVKVVVVVVVVTKGVLTRCAQLPPWWAKLFLWLQQRHHFSFFFLVGFFPAVIQSPNFVAAVSLTLSFSFFLFCSIVFSRNEN
jgi:hypothetical protein